MDVRGTANEYIENEVKIRSLAPSALVRDFNVHVNAAGDADKAADGEEMALLIPELENDPYVKAAVDRLCIRSAYLISGTQQKC